MARVAVSSSILVAFALLFVLDLPCLISARECTSMDIRNTVKNFEYLEGCTIVKGFLVIGLLHREPPSYFNNLTFPELKEITDFLLMYDVKGLADMRKMFPNLAVIRGRRLFLDYALSISNMPDLIAIEFRSLIAIQRGHVFIANCPKLCYLDRINWDRLTLTPGENHIYPEEGTKCDYAECKGCDYCWSNNFCQKFENTNLVDLTQSTYHCHPSCLGGCYNSTSEGCYLCKGISDHGACVDECPKNLYLSEHYQHCYTKEECYALKHYLFKNECNRRCPAGFTHSRKVGLCIKCASGCKRECYPDEHENEVTITSLAHAEDLKRCEILKGSIFISLRNAVNENDLIESFKQLRVVEGYVKISYSPFIKSLNFLKNLERIEGSPLENDTFSLVLYSNDNLEELWTPPAGKNVEFVNGGIYSYGNRKLCNKKIETFGKLIVHNKEKDLIQINDQEVLCEPVRLYVYVEETTYKSALLAWTRNQTAEEVEIIYREAKYDLGEDSELDDNICMRVHWQRELMFDTDITLKNETHYMYNISNLLPYTKYEYLVKTFRIEDYYSARTPVQKFVTKPDLPTAPKLATMSKSPNSITIMWTPRNVTNEVVNYYLLETFEQFPDLETLDSRPYCEQPVEYFADNILEDFDDCCQKKREEIEDDQFTLDIEASFDCGLNSHRKCHKITKKGDRTNISIVDRRAVNFTITDLKHFTKYTFFLFACNELGCGTYSMHTDRTTVVKEFDLITNAYSCRVKNSTQYLVRFSEPPTPNGAVLNYLIQFHNSRKVDVPTVDYGFVYCLSRKLFEENEYEYPISFEGLKYDFDKFSVRVVTTGGSALSDWFPIDTHVCVPRSRFTILRIIVGTIALIGLLVLGWFTYKRRWLTIERLHAWRRGTRSFRSVVGMEENQELVSTFDTVEYRASRESVF